MLLLSLANAATAQFGKAEHTTKLSARQSWAHGKAERTAKLSVRQSWARNKAERTAKICTAKLRRMQQRSVMLYIAQQCSAWLKYFPTAPTPRTAKAKLIAVKNRNRFEIPFQIVSTRTRFFRLLANVILQESWGTGPSTIFFGVKTISVSFTTSKVERHATLLQVIKVPSRKTLLIYRHCLTT